MRKLLVALALGFVMLTTAGGGYAITLEYHANGQLNGISEVDVDGTLYDATFYNQWTLSGQQTYEASFAEAATNALKFLWTNDSTLHSDYFAAVDQQHIWGCEYQATPCNLITPVFARSSPIVGGTSYTVRGFMYVVGSTSTAVVDSGYLTFDNNTDQNYTTSWVQWAESPVVGAIPEPEIYAMLGVGLGLMGWVGRRKRRQAA